MLEHADIIDRIEVDGILEEIAVLVEYDVEVVHCRALLVAIQIFEFVNQDLLACDIALFELRSVTVERIRNDVTIKHVARQQHGFTEPVRAIDDHHLHIVIGNIR